MEVNNMNDSVEKTTGSEVHGTEVGSTDGSMAFPGVTAVEVKIQAGDVVRNENNNTATTSIGNGPRFVNTIEPGKVIDTQKLAGVKVGTWRLNPNTLKKLGIESSVMNALSKQRKVTAANPAPIGSIVQIKSPPKPTTIESESSSKTSSLNSQINSNFNQKILYNQPKKFQILSNVVLTEPIIDVSGKNLPAEVIKQSIVHIQPQTEPKNNFMSNPTPVALICSRPPALESRKLHSIRKISQPTPGPSRDAFVFKTKPVTLICNQSSALETLKRISIHSTPIAQIAEISEANPANIYSSFLQQPLTSRAYDVEQPISMTSSTGKAQPTINKDGIGLGVANASPPVLKLLNNKLRAKLDIQRNPSHISDQMEPMNRSAPIRSYGSSKNMQKNLEFTETSCSKTNIIASEIKLEPHTLHESAPRLTEVSNIPVADQLPIHSTIYESPKAWESVKVEVVGSKKPLPTSDDTTTSTQPVSGAPKQILLLSPAKTTATQVPKTPSSAPSPTMSPSTSPELLGFRRQDLRYSESLLKIFTDAQADRSQNKRGKRSTTKVSIIPKRKHTSSTGSQTGDEFAVAVNSSNEEVLSISTKGPAPMKLDPDEADDEISDTESRKTAKSVQIEKTTLEEAVKVEIIETHLAPKPLAIAKGKYRRIKAIPVPVVRKRGDGPSSVEDVQTTQVKIPLDLPESVRPTDSVQMKIEQPTLTPIERASGLCPIAKETETERQIKTKKMQAMLLDRTSLQNHTTSVPTPHKFTTPSERPRTAVKHFSTSDDDSSETNTHSRPQRPKRQSRKIATSVDKVLKTEEMSEDSNINIQELNDRSGVLLEQIAKYFTGKPKAPSHLESTSPATSDVDSSFVKYQARLSATKDRIEREKQKYAEVLMKNNDLTLELQPDITSTVPPEDKIAEPESAENINWIVNTSVHPASNERQNDLNTGCDQNEENLPGIQPDIASAEPTNEEDELSKPEPLENVNWLADSVNNTSDVLFTKSGTDEDDVKPFTSTSRMKPRTSILFTLVAEHLDRDTLMADILKAEYSRFIMISSDESSGEDNEVPDDDDDDDEQHKVTDDSTDFIIPIFERDSGVVTEDNMEADSVAISVDPLRCDTNEAPVSEYEYVITELDHEEIVKAESSLPNDEIQAYAYPVSDQRTDIENEAVHALEESSFVDNELEDDSRSEFVEDSLGETRVMLMESEVGSTVEIAITGEDGVDVTEQNAVDFACSLGVSNQIQSNSYDTMQNSSTESVEDRFVVYEPTGIEVDHRSWEENNVSQSQDAVEMSAVVDETEISDHLVRGTDCKEKVSEKSSRNLESLKVEFKEMQENCLLDMGQKTATIDCEEQPIALEAAIADVETQNPFEDSSSILQEVIQDQLPKIEISTKKKRISIKPLKIPREKTKFILPAEPKNMKTVQNHSITHIKNKTMAVPSISVIEPSTISNPTKQHIPSKDSTETGTSVTATSIELEVESRPVCPPRPNRSRAHIIDSDDERSAKTEVIVKEESFTDQPITKGPERAVTHSELAAPLPAKRKRTVKSYADFFTGDDYATHKVDETPPAKRSRRSTNKDEIDIVTPTPRRGRKAKVLDTSITTDEQSSNSTTEIPSELPVDTEIADEPKPSSKRGRPSKVTATPTSPADENATQTSPADEKPTSKRGRRPKSAAIPTSSSDDKATSNPALPPIVTCGNCKEQMESSQWNAHVAYHYGLAWLDGIEKGVDMDINNSKANKIMSYMKVRKMTTLKCHNCPDIKRSAVGYLSHLEVCGLTKEQRKEMMYQCPYCPSELRKVSIQSHNEYCSGLRQQRLQEKQEEAKALMPPAETGETDQIDDFFKPSMRQSAMKAIRSFKSINEDFVEKPEDCIRRFNTITAVQYKNWSIELDVQGCMKCPEVDCDYQTDVRKEMYKHYRECLAKKDSRYYCGRCSAAPDTYAAILDHVKSAHTLRKRKHDNIFEDSGSEAELGKESSDSDGPSGDEEFETDGDPEVDEADANEYRRKRHKSNPSIDNGPDRLLLETHANSLKGYSANCFFKPTIEWTQDYRESHYFTMCAYPFALPAIIRVLTTEEAVPYLPTSQQSPEFCLQHVNNYNMTRIPKQWSRLDTFSSIANDDSCVIYAGGPIQLLEWLPLPDSYTESQLLAIVCKRDASEHIYNNPKQPSVCCTLQIWNIDRLQNPICDRAGKVGGEPRLLYNVAYDDGPTMACAFCPSGGYTDDRLGLIALPTHDGDVRVMALPKNFTCDSSGLVPVLRLEPSLVLTSGRGQKANEQITKIAWSKAKGHHIIVAGYANGLVIIWRLNNMDSPLIRMEVDGIRTLLPVRVFYSGTETIKLIDMHHDVHGDTRWLIVGSHDNKVKFYDLQGSDCEISIAQLKSRVTCGYWPLHWTSFISSIDDTYSLYTAGIGVRQPLDLGTRSTMVNTSIGPTHDVAYSDWLHASIFVTGNGDIRVSYFQQFISGFIETQRRRNAILGYTDFVEINNVPTTEQTADITTDPPDASNVAAIIDTDMQISDDIKPLLSSLEANASQINPNIEDIPVNNMERGIVFYDLLTPVPSICVQASKQRMLPLPLVNNVRINKVTLNSNLNAYKWYAIGYELGFVRIKCLVPMTLPKQYGRSCR